jgi:hypothetical protein
MMGQEKTTSTYFIIRIFGKVNEFMFLDPVVRNSQFFLDAMCFKSSIKVVVMPDFASG